MKVSKEVMLALDRAEAEGRVTGNKVSLPEDASEKEFQQRVIDEARKHGWLAYHTQDSRRSEAGFPDLVLVRDRVIFVELKSATGKVSCEQGKWLAGLARAKAEWHVWRPCDWPRIEEILKGEP